MDLRKIISEEMNSYITEQSVDGNGFKFKQAIQNSTFFNYTAFTTEFDTDISESNIVITWAVGFKINESGIEKLNITCEGVEGTYLVKYYNLHSDALEQTLDKNIAEIKWNYIIDATIENGGSLYVSSLDFDFKNNSCIINF